MARTLNLNNNHEFILTCNVSHLIILFIFICLYVFVSLFHHTVTAGWELFLPNCLNFSRAGSARAACPTMTSAKDYSWICHR